jgi:Ca2+-binding RTX toxin-like protein
LGDTGDDALFGGPGADTLSGGWGRDVLSGDLGDDVLTGDAEADVFTFASGQGRDLVRDFSPGDRDVIRLAVDINGSGIRTAADALARLVWDGAGTVLDLGAGNSLRIAGLAPAIFELDDFWVA